MTLGVIFLILALICFMLAAAKVQASIDFTNAGFAFVVAWVLAGSVIVG